MAAAAVIVPVAATLATGAPLHVCHLCRRKFHGADALALHEQRSSLHRLNLEKQNELIQQHKNQVLTVIHTLRQQLHEVASGVRPASAVDGGSQPALEGKLRQLLGEYSQAQEMLEHGIRTSGGGFATGSPASAVRPPLRCEARVGRFVVEVGATAWLGSKDVQEDRFALDIELQSPEGHALLGICVMDGHSGSRCVDHIIRRLQPTLQACISSKPALTDDCLRQAVDEACALLDGEFLQNARLSQAMDGSTMVLALIYPELFPTRGASPRPAGSCRLLIANIGDSRAVLCRAVEKGVAAVAKPAQLGASSPALTALRLSDDHKPNRPDEQQRIQARGGVVDWQGVWRVFVPSPVMFNGRHIPRWGLAVSRAFGDLLLKEPERYGCENVVKPGGLVTAVPEQRIVELDPSQDRFLVLACDGIWDVLRDEDAVAVCAAQAGAELASHALVRHAFAAGSSDNLTALVVTWRVFR